jgi:hypothetical protein
MTQLRDSILFAESGPPWGVTTSIVYLYFVIVVYAAASQMSNPSLRKLLDGSATPAQLKRCESAFCRLYPNVPLAFIIKTFIGISYNLAQVSGGDLSHAWWDLCQFDSVWKLNWARLHDRHAAVGAWASSVEADSLWFSSETGDTREPLGDWQRAEPER